MLLSFDLVFKNMGKCVEKFLIIVFILFVPVFSRAEVLIFPPGGKVKPYFSENLLFLSNISGWFDFHHYLNNGGNDNFSQDSELALLFTLVSTNNFSFQAISREIIQNEVNYVVETSLGFYLRALISDLRVIATFKGECLMVSFGFRHDCKHDIDRFMGRNVVHDALFLDFFSDEIVFEWQNAHIFSSLLFGIEGEINLPYIFQEVKPEPDKARFSLILGFNPVGIRERGNLFIKSKFSVIRRNTVGFDIYPIVDPAYDWNIQGGINISVGRGDIVLYYEAKHITDPWVDNNSFPVLLKGMGITLNIY